MSAPVQFSPNSLDFGSVASGRIGLSRSVTISKAPVDAQVTASINGADSSFFKVVSVRNFQRTLVPVDPGELPPGFKGHPKTVVLEQVGQSDGVTKLAVSKDQFVSVEVGVTAPMSLVGRDSITSTLHIQGDTWESVLVPLTMQLAHIETTLVGSVVVFEFGTGSLSIVLRSVSGPDTVVTYDIIPRPDLSEKGISLSPGPKVVTVQRGQTVPTTLFFRADATVVTGQFFHLGMVAFSNSQGESFVLTAQVQA
jgi:hypothetical protein